MNGSNSNTNGSNVANIGFWPSAILPSIVTKLGVVITSLKGLIEKTVLPGTVDFAAQAGSDKIPDAVMEEIVRRLVVTVEKQDLGNIIYQVNPPDDHTKAWWQIDPVTQLPVGRLKQWDEDAADWVPVDDTGGTYTPPARRNGILVSPAGTSTQNFEFEDIKTSDYAVSMQPTTYDGSSSSWKPAPSSFPAAFGYVIVNKTNTSLSVAFFGVPTGGITWEVDITDRKTTA